MDWVLTLEAMPGSPSPAVAHALDDLLSALERIPGVGGPVTFADPRNGTLGARFDVEAPAVEDALAAGLRVFAGASRTAGITAPVILRAEIAVADHDGFAPGDR